MESLHKKLHGISRSMKPGSSHPFNPPTGFKPFSSQVVDPKGKVSNVSSFNNLTTWHTIVQRRTCILG